MKIKNFDVVELLGITAHSNNLSNVVSISGQNGAGKTRLINLLLSTITWKGIPDKMKEEMLKSEGEITVELDNGLTITRKIKDAKPYLSVKTKEGLRANQTVLDNLIGNNFVDVGKLFTMNSKQLAKIILELNGLEKVIEDEQNKIKQLTQQRTLIGQKRDLYKVVPVEKVEEVDITEIYQKIENINEQQIAKEKISQRMISCSKQLGDRFTSIRDNTLKIQELYDMILELSNDNWKAFLEIGSLNDFIDNDKKIKDSIQIENKDIYIEQLKQAKTINAQYQHWLRYQQTIEEYERFAQQYNQLTEKIAKADADLKHKIAIAPMPIKELSYDLNDGLLFNGHIIASSGEIIKLGVKILHALKTELKVATVDDWNLLDENNKQIILEACKEAGFQLIFCQVKTIQNTDELLIIENENEK
jgi:hypothetical protein